VSLIGGTALALVVVPGVSPAGAVERTTGAAAPPITSISRNACRSEGPEVGKWTARAADPDGHPAITGSAAAGVYVYHHGEWRVVFVAATTGPATTFTGTVTGNGFFNKTRRVTGGTVTLAQGGHSLSWSFHSTGKGEVGSFGFSTQCMDRMSWHLVTNSRPTRKKDIYLGQNLVHPTDPFVTQRSPL
jgi:hypothetical protein